MDGAFYPGNDSEQVQVSQGGLIIVISNLQIESGI